MEGTQEVKPDLPTRTDFARKLNLKDVTVNEAREKLVLFLTAHWQRNLITLAQKLTEQGFSQQETLELCESFRPMFDENMTAFLTRFDEEAEGFAALCTGGGQADG